MLVQCTQFICTTIVDLAARTSTANSGRLRLGFCRVHPDWLAFISGIVMKPPTTECGCTKEGWCGRHRCFKPAMVVRLCQRDPKLFALWESGIGPGQLNRRHEDKDPRGKSKRLQVLKTPCRHRELTPIRYVDCPVCTTEKVTFSIFPCNLYGECTLLRMPSVGAVEPSSCIQCGDYIAVENQDDNP